MFDSAVRLSVQVDLVRFRAMAAGDQLRVIYDNLSKDPGSLANLDQVGGADPVRGLPRAPPCAGLGFISPTISRSAAPQDLPNYAQHGVPIFSLPQEWLWCESWCGNATKAAAKTIDLCNNPQTKEPKLEGARRIVPEWVGLDEEARNGFGFSVALPCCVGSKWAGFDAPGSGAGEGHHGARGGGCAGSGGGRGWRRRCSRRAGQRRRARGS